MGEGSQARRYVALVVAIMLAVMLIGFSGCKYSDVLTQHTEDPELGVLDEGADPTYQSNPDAEERPDLDDVSVSDSDDENTQVGKLPHYDPDAPDNGPTKRLVNSSQTPHDQEAAEGTSDQEPDREGEGEGDQGGEEVTSGDGEGEGTGEGTGEELTSDEADDPSQSAEGGAGDTTVIVNPDGTTDDTSKGTVAAVGEYATMAQMLGGAGALAGCDATWLAEREDDGAFNGELEHVEVAFSGDGTKAGSCDVDALVKTIQPSVVLWDSAANVPALSESERTQLENAGISVQPMPHIGTQGTEDCEVMSALQEVASILSGASALQYDPLDVLEKYTEFHDGALKTCYDTNGGYSYKITDSQYNQLYQDTPLSGLTNATSTRVVTVFVDDVKKFGSHATVSQAATTVSGVLRLTHDGQSLDVSDGVGVSVKSSTRNYMLLDYYLQLAGAVNNAYDTAMPESQGRRYILMPGNTSAFGTTNDYASRITGSAFFFNAGDSTVPANWHALGDDGFDTVLVASDEIADVFANSASKSDGLYHMDQSYNVVVVPTGINGSWSEGHLDSFLLAPWAFRIQDPASLDAAKSYASNFYATYLRCSDWESAIDNWDSVYTAQ